MSLEVPLTKGFVARVDERDAWVLNHSWCVTINRSANSERPYAVRRKPGHPSNFIYLHRAIAKTPAHLDCDHKNGDTLDNTRANLRNVSRSLNNLNRQTTRGVYYHKTHRLWQAYINLDRRRRHLGWFKTRAEALVARLEAERRLL